MPMPLLAVCVSLLAAACSTRVHAQAGSSPPPIAREFRGVWVATVENTDFPSKPGLPAAALRGELDAIVARAVDLRLNALVFQVRPAADAFYPSPLEPWSEYLSGTQGQAPDGNFDPLAYVIERCHEHGLQLHAWFNPFRAKHKSSRATLAQSHITQKAKQLVVPYGGYLWMDPGQPLAAKWSLAIIQDVVKRYDVDGVHLDDYFYPYPVNQEPFPDDASYEQYRRGGGSLTRSDWRRANIDDFVQRLYQIVHEAKPWVAVGISPFGIARKGMPAGIQAGLDQYEQLSADVVKWLREGWLDYLAPQLYWPIDRKAQSFPVLLAWWHAQNTRQRGLWPGLATYRMLASEKDHRPQELAEQIALVRAAGRTTGHIHFSWRSLRTDAPNVGGALRRSVYREVALPPAMSWLSAEGPAAPVARLEADGKQIAWLTDDRARFVVVQVRDGGGWRTAEVTAASRKRIDAPNGVLAVAVTAVSPTGATSPATVLTR